MSRGGLWNEAPEPVLPDPGAARRVLGWIRVIALALLTAAALGLYALFKGVERLIPAFTLRQSVQGIWARIALRMLGLRLNRVGTPMQQGGAMVGNHASWSDIIALRACAQLYFVSKSEVRDWPGVGLIARVTDTIFIERKRTAAKRQEAELKARIARGDHLMVFPEGTSTDGRRVLAFKSSLFAAFLNRDLRETVWVQPVSVVYRLGEGVDLPPDFFGWWGEMDFGPHLLVLASHRHRGQVTVAFHPPVRASDFIDRKALAQHCEAEVRAGLESHLPKGVFLQ